MLQILFLEGNVGSVHPAYLQLRRYHEALYPPCLACEVSCYVTRKPVCSALGRISMSQDGPQYKSDLSWVLGTPGHVHICFAAAKVVDIKDVSSEGRWYGKRAAGW